GTGAITASVGRNTLIANNVSIVAGGAFTIATDDFSLGPLGAITSGGPFTITTFTPGRVISVGADTPGQLGLTGTELSRITSSVVRIGTLANTGGIVVAGPVLTPGFTQLELRTSGTVTDTAAGALTVPSLAVQGSSV